MDLSGYLKPLRKDSAPVVYHGQDRGAGNPSWLWPGCAGLRVRQRRFAEFHSLRFWRGAAAALEAELARPPAVAPFIVVRQNITLDVYCSNVSQDLHQVRNGMQRQRPGGEQIPLERPIRLGLAATQLMLIALAASSLVSCTNIHCGTEGKGGGPGGCGMDLKFTTTDNVTPPGSFEDPERRPLEPP
jgi:hypothetical protein